MGLFERRHVIIKDGEFVKVTREEKIQDLFEDFLEIGDECNIIFSEEVMSGKNPLLSAATTAGFGLGGLAYSMPTLEHKKYGGKIKPAEKGLVLTISTSEMRRNIKIPWSSIVSASRTHNGFTLQLIDDDVIAIHAGGPPKLLKRYEEYKLLVIDYINSKACGVVEDGWD